MEGDGQLDKDSKLKNKVSKHYNSPHTHPDSVKEVYQNTVNAHSHSEWKRDENTRSSNGDGRSGTA